MNTLKLKPKEFVFREQIKRNIYNPPTDIKINSIISSLFKKYDKIYKDVPINQNVKNSKYNMRLRILIYLLFIFYINNTKCNTNTDFYNEHIYSKHREFLMIKSISDDSFEKTKQNIINSVDKQYHLTNDEKNKFKNYLQFFFDEYLDNINENTDFKKRNTSKKTKSLLTGRKSSKKLNTSKKAKSQQTRKKSSKKSSKKRVKSQPTIKKSSKKPLINNFFRNNKSNKSSNNDE